MKGALTYRNNWEQDEYYLDDVRITDLTLVSIDDKEYNVIQKNEGRSFSDWGQTYLTTSKSFFVETPVFGITLPINLNRLIGKVDIFPLKYRTEY